MPRCVLAPLLLVAMFLAACGGGNQPASTAPVGHPDNGTALFHSSSIASSGAPGCAACHAVEPGKTLVGPSLADIERVAARRIRSADYKGTAQSSDEYIRESIVQPQAYVVPGFAAGTMPNSYTGLDQQALNDLVSYLMTLK